MHTILNFIEKRYLFRLMENPQNPSKASSRKQFYFLTLSHTVLDSYATLLSHLQPLLLTKLATVGARNSLAGNFVAIYSVFSSFGQIVFGWLSDRLQTVHFLTIGVAFSAIGLSLLWLAPSVNVVYLLLAIGGIGIAAFHPQATTYAGALASEDRGLGTSIFLTGGNVGRALGPLVLMFIPYRFGLKYLVWEMIPGLLVAFLVPKVLRFEKRLDLTATTRGTPNEAPRPQEPLWTVASPRMLPLIILFIIAALPNCYANGFRNLSISPLRRSKLLGSSALSCYRAFYFRWFYGYHVKWMADESCKHLCPLIGIVTRCSSAALCVVTH